MAPMPWGQIIPLAVVGLVLALRLRGLSRPSPLRVRTMWLGPVVFTVLAGLLLGNHPPDGPGWLAFGGALALGAALGWQRGRFTRMEREAPGGRIMLRQSPAGIVLLVLVIAARWALRGAMGGGDPAHATGPAVWLLLDGTLGFALGFVGVYRLEIALRARRI